MKELGDKSKLVQRKLCKSKELYKSGKQNGLGLLKICSLELINGEQQPGTNPTDLVRLNTEPRIVY